ncbi:hypothetical protein QR98_0037270 [Sarcoptes scabiei]|uniref:Uncharacterized protein n=1 Tax=Sarcoptes scabiei TaxID=52283 RepID=A0A132A2K6_SARSC|nr:hypothetical protein QR98_0037270 [Sarcoptes scabiei]
MPNDQSREPLPLTQIGRIISSDASAPSPSGMISRPHSSSSTSSQYSSSQSNTSASRRTSNLLV